MKLFLVTFVGQGYDTYQCLAIVAETRKQARALANKQTNSQPIKNINEVNLTRKSVPRVLCADFYNG